MQVEDDDDVQLPAGALTEKDTLELIGQVQAKLDEIRMYHEEQKGRLLKLLTEGRATTEQIEADVKQKVLHDEAKMLKLKEKLEEATKRNEEEKKEIRTDTSTKY